MSDPLSIAAGIAGIVNTGLQVAQGLHQIADGIGSAGVEVRVYAKEISSFSKVLLLIRTKVLRPTGITIDELVLVKDITDICEEVVAPLNRIQETLRPLLERHRHCKKKVEQFGKRIHWYFSQKQKLLFYREALRGHQQNLDSVLAAINYDTTRDIANQMALRNTLLEGLVVMSGFQGGIVRKQVAFDSQSSAGLLPPSSSDDEREGEHIPQPAENQSSNDGPLSAKTTDPQNSIATIPSDSGGNSDLLTELELQEINDAVDRDLDPDQGSSALVLWEDIRVTSRKTKKFAEEILRNTEQGTTAFNPVVTAEPSPTNLSPIRDEATKPTLRARSSRERVPTAASSNGESAPFGEDTIFMPSEITRQSFDERVLQDSDPRPRKQQTIMLEIPRGQRYELPFEEVYTWTGMHAAICTVYFGDHNIFDDEFKRDILPSLEGTENRVYDALYQSKFHLKGSQGQIILRQMWDSIIEPDRQVSLEFQDIFLNQEYIRKMG